MRDTPSFKNTTITFHQPSSLLTFQAAGKPCLTFKLDGSIEIGDGFTPDEAGKAAIEAMRGQLDYIIKAAVAAEREACAKLVDPPEDIPTSPEARIGQSIRRMFAVAIRARRTT